MGREDHPAWPTDSDMDDMLLKAILAQEIGTIANIIQAASELEGTLYERLSGGYYELTNTDPRARTDEIGLKDFETWTWDPEDGDELGPG